MLDLTLIKPHIRSILAASDLETVSAKQVRKRLIADGLDEDDVKQAKEGIDEIIADIFDSLQSTPPSSPSASPSTFKKPLLPAEPVLPTPPSSALQAPPSSYPEPLSFRKKPKSVKKENQDSHEDDHDKDALYAQQLSSQLNSHSTRAGPSKRPSSFNPKANRSSSSKRKHTSSKEVASSDDSANSSPFSDEDLKPSKKKTRKSKKEGKSPGGDNNPFNKPMQLSGPLSALLGGVEQLSRPKVVKGLWAYVKERDLQDPSDRRYIICQGDPLLAAIFQTPRVHMFTLNKILAKHLWPINE